MEFKKCRRSYFFKYMWKIELPESRANNPVEVLEEESRIEDLDYGQEDNNEKTVIEASLRGNIVHDFCNNYRMGMDIEELMTDSILNYNLEPTKEILEEIRPYVYRSNM